MKKKSAVTDFHGIATIGERGQVVIPREAREKLGLKKGEKLIVFSGEHGLLALAKASTLKKRITELAKLIEPLS